MDTKFGTKVSNKILMNAAKCQGLQLLLFLGIPLLRENQLGRDKITSPSPPTQIRVKRKKKIILEYECVKVPVPAHQVLSLTWYIFEASCSTSATRANKFRIWTNQNS